MKRVICLYRVSTIGQVDHDDIPMQKTACREYAETHPDWQIIDEISEKGVSGYKLSSDERDAIQITDVEDDRNHTNPEWNSVNRFGGTTEDQIFLLSYQEMRSLVDSQDRLCEPSAATSRKGIYTENHNGHKCCWYWLRTSAYRNNVVVVAANGSFDTCYLHHEYGVVRPALWVDASAVTQ